MSRADLAVAYAQRGWHVFTLRVGAKEPHGRSGLNGATDDLVTVRRWWQSVDYNIGINCGASQLFVVDLDVKPEKGDAGYSRWVELCELHECSWEETYCVVTPRGGMHVYWRTDLPLRSSASELGINIDTRGLGGYVVAAGSVVEDVEYDSVAGDVPLPIPTWLAERFQPRPEPTRRETLDKIVYEMHGNENNREHALRGILVTMQTAEEGERNNVLHWCARAIVDHLWTDDFKDEAYARLEGVAIMSGLTPREIRDTIASAQRRGFR